MIGSADPVMGTVALSSRLTRRSGVGRTMGLKDSMADGDGIEMFLAAPMRAWSVLCMIFISDS